MAQHLKRLYIYTGLFLFRLCKVRWITRIRVDGFQENEVIV